MQASIDIAMPDLVGCNAIMALGENIAAWRTKRGWSTHRLAIESETNQSSISRYETNKARPRPETLLKIAEALGAEVAQLEYGHLKLDGLETVPIGKRRIPILGLEQVSKRTGKEPTQYGKGPIDYVLTNENYSPETFALAVFDESMSPTFLPGDILTVDPKVSPNPGNYVLAIDETDEKAFRTFAHIGSNSAGRPIYELKPSNPLFPTWNSETRPFTISGTVMESRRRYF